MGEIMNQNKEIEKILLACVNGVIRKNAPDLKYLKGPSLDRATKAIEQLLLRARIEVVNQCIQLQLGTKTNDFDALYDKLKKYKSELEKELK